MRERVWWSAPSCLVASLAASGCTAVLDFSECRVDEHCDPGQRCIAAVCMSTDDTTIEVSENITEDTEWTADATYRLTNTIYVEPGVTLTIRSGTRILGEEGSALIVQAGGELRSRGTPDAPVVFTSAQPEGERRSGDWGGVALLGQAPTNAPGSVLEGVSDAERAGFGGNDPGHSCGVLEYTRVEFAGFPLKQDNELNGLTLGGCGSGTLVDHVQVHFGLDDGVEIFGGTVDLRNIVITRAQDDSLDWDLGWSGSAQFIAIQQDSEGDNGFEASSGAEGATPVALPKLWNVTFIGSGGQGSQRAMTLKDGTGGSINNVLITGHPIEAIDVWGAEVVERLQSGELELRGALMFAVGAGGDHWFPLPSEEAEGDADDDEGFDEDAFFRALPDITFGVNPNLNGPFNLSAPGWVPQGNAAIEAGVMPGAPLFDGFDEQAGYAGAFAPGTVPWTDGWTAYPEN
ncbi:MAG: hypothetical protein AB1Z98_07880 [Nannocystaceae bacterium]